MTARSAAVLGHPRGQITPRTPRACSGAGPWPRASAPRPTGPRRNGAIVPPPCAPHGTRTEPARPHAHGAPRRVDRQRKGRPRGAARSFSELARKAGGVGCPRPFPLYHAFRSRRQSLPARSFRFPGSGMPFASRTSCRISSRAISAASTSSSARMPRVWSALCKRRAAALPLPRCSRSRRRGRAAGPGTRQAGPAGGRRASP